MAGTKKTHVGWQTILIAVLAVIVFATIFGSVLHAIWAFVKTLILLAAIAIVAVTYVEHKLRQKHGPPSS